MISKYIVHIIHDDKFIDMAMREFEAVAPGIHKFVIIGRARSLRYIKSKSILFHDRDSAKLLINLPNCAAVVFHAIPDLSYLRIIPGGKKIIWLGWGFDYYDRLLTAAFPTGLFLNKTRQLFNAKQSLARRTVRKIKSTVKWAIGRGSLQNKQLLTKVSAFSPVLDVEYRLACQLNPWFKPDYLAWNYGTLEDDMLADGGSCTDPLGPHVLVGNSASFENNHLEVFDYLERHVDLTALKIYAPLSYGDDLYKEKIITAGYKKFGDQFVPLTDFMEKDKYIALLQSCGHVFMNHLRQQAVGNICIMMLKGAKIYMNPQSPLYQWLLDRNAVISAVGSTAFNAEASNQFADKHTLTPLTAEQITCNQQAIRTHWGKAQQRLKTRQLIDYALQAA